MQGEVNPLQVLLIASFQLLKIIRGTDASFKLLFQNQNEDKLTSKLLSNAAFASLLKGKMKTVNCVPNEAV